MFKWAGSSLHRGVWASPTIQLILTLATVSESESETNAKMPMHTPVSTPNMTWIGARPHAILGSMT